MKLAEKVRAMARRALYFGKHWTRASSDYPTQIIELIIFHKLHSAMTAENAMRSYRLLKEKFVDWNEVRISSMREIQDELQGAPDSLQLAVFIKDLLEFVHRERQDMSLEFLAEQNLGEIRRYLKQVKGLDGATIGLILRLRKEYPIFPLNQAMESVLERLGLLRGHESKDQKERVLNELVDDDKVLVLHHFLMNHSLEFCPPNESEIDCPRCNMRQMCAFYAQLNSKARKKNSSRRGSAPGVRHANSRSKHSRSNHDRSNYRDSRTPPGASAKRLAGRSFSGRLAGRKSHR